MLLHIIGQERKCVTASIFPTRGRRTGEFSSPTRGTRAPRGDPSLPERWAAAADTGFVLEKGLEQREGDGEGQE